MFHHNQILNQITTIELLQYAWHENRDKNVGTVSYLCGGIYNSQVSDQIYLGVLFNPFCSLA